MESSEPNKHIVCYCPRLCNKKWNLKKYLITDRKLKQTIENKMFRLKLKLDLNLIANDKFKLT